MPKMTTAVMVLTISVLLRLFCSIMEMLMMGTPKMVRQVVEAWHCRVIRKYIALPEIKKMPKRIMKKYLVIL